MTDRPVLKPKEGWHVLHLFYRIEYGQWELLSGEEKLAAKTNLASLIQHGRALQATQLLTFSVVTPKADIGFMMVTEDLHTANLFEKRLTLSLGPDILNPVYSFYSLTERSEYNPTEEAYGASLISEGGLQQGSPEFEKSMSEYRERTKKYIVERIYPTLPDWPVICFYPMTKRRNPQQNWYELSYKERKVLMAGHGKVGRQYSGRVRQVITGSTGLDDAEWGVTLFAHDTFDIKSIVYDMRFDAVSAQYADFGDFYIGLQMPLNQLFEIIQL